MTHNFKEVIATEFETPTKEAFEFCEMQAGLFKWYLATLYDNIKESGDIDRWKERLESHTEESIRIVEFYLCKNYGLCG